MSIFGRHNDPDGKNGMGPETMDEIEKDELKLLARLKIRFNDDAEDDDEREDELDEARDYLESDCDEMRAVLRRMSSVLEEQKEMLETLINKRHHIAEALPDAFDMSFFGDDMEEVIENLEDAVSALDDCLEELEEADSNIDDCIDDIDLIG